MDLNLDDDQRLLAESARQLFERTYPTTEARTAEELPERFARDLWTQTAELGWPGIALPEDCGGAGYGVLELAVLAEELGRAAVTLTAPVVVRGDAAAAVGGRRCGTGALARRRLTERRRDRRARAARARRPAPSSRRRRVERHVARRRLDAVGHQGRGAASGPSPTSRSSALTSTTAARSLVAVAADAPGVERAPHDTFSPEPIAAVTFTDVAVAPDDVVGERGGAHRSSSGPSPTSPCSTPRTRSGCATPRSALAVEHATNREQFGRPIGVNQAVSHQCVDIRVESDAMRVLAHQAAWRLDRYEHDPAGAMRAVALANAYARDVAPRHLRPRAPGARRDGLHDGVRPAVVQPPGQGYELTAGEPPGTSSRWPGRSGCDASSRAHRLSSQAHVARRARSERLARIGAPSARIRT